MSCSLNADILNLLQPVSLEEMKKVRLMNRIDTKFVTDVDSLLRLFELASQDYMIQQIDGLKNMTYSTLYFDTPEADMFYQHVRGKKTRQKVRIRSYDDTDQLPFLEIKLKNNKGRTRKKRIPMEEGEKLQLYSEFLTQYSPYNPEILMPRISNNFHRVTLVNKEMTERITIDTDLGFHNLITLQDFRFENICIIEWKRDGNMNNSVLERLLRQLHIHQQSFSKYCVGMALTDQKLKQNRLKPKLRVIEKIEA